jgi:hypothetical protein
MNTVALAVSAELNIQIDELNLNGLHGDEI